MKMLKMKRKEDKWDKAYKALCKRAGGKIRSSYYDAYVIINFSINHEMQSFDFPYYVVNNKMQQVPVCSTGLNLQENIVKSLLEAGKNSDVVFHNNKLIRKGETLENLLVEADLMYDNNE